MNHYHRTFFSPASKICKYPKLWKFAVRISIEDWMSRHFPKPGKEISNAKERVIQQCVSLATVSLPPGGVDMKFNYLNLSKQIMSKQKMSFLVVINYIVLS